MIPPGTYHSDARDQGASQATLARVRVPYSAGGGTGSVGALLSDRTYEDGGSKTARQQWMATSRTTTRGCGRSCRPARPMTACWAARVTDTPATWTRSGDNGTYHGWLGLAKVSPKVPQRQLHHHPKWLRLGH